LSNLNWLIFKVTDYFFFHLKCAVEPLLHFWLFIYFSLLYCRYIVIFTKVLTIFHTWIHPLRHSPSSHPAPLPGIVWTGIIFPFAYMCAPYLKHIHPPTPFPHLLHPPTGIKIVNHLLKVERLHTWIKSI
jgi:hypothetical protein